MLHLELPCFVIELRVTVSAYDLFRSMASVDCGAAVTFLLGVFVIGVIAGRGEHLVGQLVNLRFGLLDADDVRILLVHPLEKTFARRRPDTVGVETYYAKQYSTPVSYSGPKLSRPRPSYRSHQDDEAHARV